MSDLTATADQTELATDAQFTDMLERVLFQPGILLGAEALSAEQTYHLRRLTRHHRWLIGPGTVFGMRVDVMNPAPPDHAQQRLAQPRSDSASAAPAARAARGTRRHPARATGPG